jgi:hypothetical protein
MFTKLSEHFEFRHFRPHYLDVDTIFEGFICNKDYKIIIDGVTFEKSENIFKHCGNV